MFSSYVDAGTIIAQVSHQLNIMNSSRDRTKHIFFYFVANRNFTDLDFHFAKLLCILVGFFGESTPLQIRNVVFFAILRNKKFRPFAKYEILTFSHRKRIHRWTMWVVIIRSSMDKLLAEHFQEIPGIPGPNRTANIWVGKFKSTTILHTHCSYWSFFKSESCGSLIRNSQAKHRLIL